ncbi:hypothetical protein BYT27DRAFT_7253630 [Phlegmacium glaucopus]|nr:hypothetical protein BYT27DRAFT_7253630 [Phlegmacium glaucopus]
MAMNLTNKVRSIAEVTKAVAGGALTKVIEVDSLVWLEKSGPKKDLTDNIHVMANSLLLQVRIIAVFTAGGTRSGFDF